MNEPEHDAESAPMGMGLIRVERQRQVDAEGYTLEHDGEHGRGVLVKAATTYEQAKWDWRWAGPFWPWDPAAFKPRDRVSNLIRAGALYLAALDQPEPEETVWAHEKTDHLWRSLDRVAAELEATMATAQRLALPGDPS